MYTYIIDNNITHVTLQTDTKTDGRTDVSSLCAGSCRHAYLCKTSPGAPACDSCLAAGAAVAAAGPLPPTAARVGAG